MTTRPNPTGGTLALAAVVVITLGAIVEAVWALTASSRVASAADWRAAGELVRASRKDGDLIVVAPTWADQVGRSYFGDLIPVEMAARADTDHYSRIWEVSIRGAHAAETQGLTAKRVEQRGLVRVSLYEKPSLGLSYDFTSHFADARISQVDGGRESPCGGTVRCPGGLVETRTLEVDYRPRRGILVPAGTQPTRLTWPEATLGKTLVLYLGLHDYYARKSGDGPVDVALFVDDRQVWKTVFRQADGWRRFELPTLPGPHAVRVEVSSPQPAWRNLGFHLESRP